MPVARLAVELRTTAVGQLAIGLAGLAVAVSAEDDSPARVVVPFAVVLALIGALSWVATRWVRGPEPPPLPGGTPVEPARQTLRRSVVGLALALVAVAAACALAPELGAVLGGVVAAAGLIDAVNLRVVRARQARTGDEVLRRLGASPFASGRRPLYTLPTNDRTLAT